MKSRFFLPLLGAVTGILLAGCLFRPVTVSSRHYILSPISTNKPAPETAEHLSVGVGFVKMPPYLLRDSMAVRNGNNEIEYLEDALWSERLDQCFQRTLAANLSRYLPSDSVYLSDWGRDQVTAGVFINVEQFDVDTRGRGTLIAQWRITAPGNEVPLKTGHAQLARLGASPRGNSDAIAVTLSDLTAEFSRELAQSIREAVNSRP